MSRIGPSLARRQNRGPAPGRVWLKWILACVCAGLLCGCPGPQPAPNPDDRSAQTDRDAKPQPLNSTDPYWVYQGNPHAKIAVVFVHGIFGDTNGTWTNANGKRFFDLLRSAPGIGDKVDVYAFGFTSKMLGQGSLDVRESSLKLHEYLDYHGVSQYDSIVFVAHSMGGLVVMRELISHPELSAKTPLLMLYATPQEGADITRIAKYVIANNAIRQMLPADANDYLKQLSDDWVGLKSSGAAPKVICAYETVKTGPVLIVPWTSATRFCDEAPPGIAGADHIGIVKPDRQEHESVVKLVNALRKYVLPRLDAGTWETPDFSPETDKWVYTLAQANDLNHAGLINKSPTRQDYKIVLPQNSKLWISPETTPRSVAAGSREDLKLFVYGVPQAEYSFTLQLASLPQRTVVVRIPDLAAARAAKAQQIEAIAQAVNARLDSEQADAAFKSLPDPQKWQLLANAAQSSIAESSPELPAGARWVAAADSLAQLGILESSVAAMRVVEQDYPQTAQAPAVRQLAAQVSAQSGKRDVFVAMPVPVLKDKDPALPRNEVVLYSASDSPALLKLARNLESTPATRSNGLSLKGDILKSQGDEAGAARAYSEAKSIRFTPLLDTKLKHAVENAQRGRET
ncbi:MAG: esterase/lipase family protein [Lysobacter sp.]